MKDAEAALDNIDSAVTRLFRRMADWTVKVLVPVAIVALMMGVARVLIDLWHAWQSPTIAQGFDLLVADILSAFVVIELLKSIVEYVDAHRLKIVLILDAAVVFLLRESMIGLYQHKLSAGEIAALAALLAVVGAFRVAAARLLPEEGGVR
ncbi:MAG TPA: phosphate-starvation-inducible PsiE family protein [Anaeromyxobacteraceae bacterium]|nr:phosphate-starvation-inducible PsiE family protein [Anaeromyxobacteraceae bacterium]